MRDQLLGDRYRLVRQLGEGGMGQVWEAQDETLGRHVAVKVISLLAGGGSRGDEARARFLREARITAQLQHPNIVTIHDLGETGAGIERVPFLVMELVRGEGLDAMLRRGVVTLADAARWGALVADALAVAHAAGIMHRDIKPSNILITPSGTVKVLDFGIARAADPYATADRLTQTGFIVGTPPYMAPEQARGFPEPRSDLYALGCLLFELITGQLPFQAPDTVGYLTAHLTQEPPTPSSVSTGVPSAWDDLVLRLLEKDPDQRYPNATDLSQVLRLLDRVTEPAPPAGGATHPPSMTATTSLPPAAPTRRASSSLPPRPDTASTHTPAGRGRATRFILPICLWLLTLASLAGPRQIGIPVALAVIWGFTAVLTPRSTSLTRGTGYVAVAAIAVQLVGFVTHFWDDLLLGLSIWWPFLTLIVLAIPSYFYREIKTRRAASSTSTPRMARRRLTRLRTVPAGRDIGEIETEPVPPPALTRKLSTGQPEAEDAAQSTDAEPPKSPASAPRWAQSRGVQLLMALSMTLVLAATAVIYYSSAARHRDTSSPPPSASATPAAQYLRMPNLCGYVQNNEMRGRAELQPGSDEPGLDGRNDSRHANCGWGSAPSVKENRFKVVITATLYGTVAGAKDAMAAITLGRSTIDVALTTSKVDDTENIPEEAKKTVQDEDATNGDRYNSTTVYFRRNNVVVEVWYVESKVQMNDTNNKDEVTGRALTWGRSLDNFLRDEPENHEQPIWG